MNTTENLATDPKPADIPPSEAAEVKALFARIEAARKHDDPARKQYAKNRRQARGDTKRGEGFVSANLVATYIEILEAFLYARDPDVDVLPSRSTQPPDMEALRDTAQMMVKQATEALGLPPPGMAPPIPVDPMAPVGIGMDPAAMAQQLVQQSVEQQALQQFEELKAAYRKRQRQNAAEAETMELVIVALWRLAGLKKRARKCVRSALTIGVGWLKGSWVERTAADPETSGAINDAQAELDNVKRLRQQIADEEAIGGDEHAAKIAELEATLARLQAAPPKIVQRGFMVDFIPGERLQVAVGVELEDYLESPWIAEYCYVRKDAAMAEFGWTKEQMGSAQLYRAVDVVIGLNDSAEVCDFNHDEANAYTKGDATEGGDSFVCIIEVWDRERGTMCKLVEGMQRYAVPPVAPVKTTRFYPYHLLPITPIDGQRHPQSLVTGSSELVDEYNRIGSAEAEHRRRIKPKTAFNAGGMSAQEASKLEGGAVGEMVGVRPTNPMQPIGDLLHPVVYPQLDPALYDRSRIVAEIERKWGIQEALSGSVSVAKTATEADIQQSGFQARTASRRDILEDMLSDLARYTAEVAAAKMTLDDVIHIVGPDAAWPDFGGPDELALFFNIEIRAGTSGKPNQKAEREAWAEILPLAEQTIQLIGQLRYSPTPEIADCLEQLFRETLARSGDRLDPNKLIPQTVGQPPILPTDPNDPAAAAANGAPVA